MVIELVSPNDRRSDIAGETCFEQNATETDYRAIGVGEIVYIDQQKRTIRVLRKTDTDDYEEETPVNAPLTFCKARSPGKQNGATAKMLPSPRSPFRTV